MKLIKHPKTLLVVIAEAALEKRLARDVEAHGAHGWTVGELHEAHLQGLREGAWEADRTIELRVICEPAVADAIAADVMQRYAAHYALALYFGEVQVLRRERF